MNSTFLQYCEVLQEIADCRGHEEKISILADYLRQLDDNREVGLAVRFAGEGAFGSTSTEKISIGHATVAKLAAEYCEIDYQKVFRPSKIAMGSVAGTIEQLFRNVECVRVKRRDVRLSLGEVEEHLLKLGRLKKSEEKKSELVKMWADMGPLEAKYFTRLIGNGDMRLGFDSRGIMDAIALCVGVEVDDVRHAHMITGSLEQTAILAKNKPLDSLNADKQRSKSWLEKKRPKGTMEVVILYATVGNGECGGLYSEFTMGVNVIDEIEYEQDFIPIGKVNRGLSDEAWERLSDSIKPLIRERFGATMMLVPQIVVEIEYDEIRENKRTKAGFTLQGTMLRSIRWEKDPSHTGTLEEVRRRYEGK